MVKKVRYNIYPVSSFIFSGLTVCVWKSANTAYVHIWRVQCTGNKSKYVWDKKKGNEIRINAYAKTDFASSTSKSNWHNICKKVFKLFLLYTGLFCYFPFLFLLFFLFFLCSSLSDQSFPVNSELPQEKYNLKA